VVTGSILASDTWWFRSHDCGLDPCSRQTIKVYKRSTDSDRHTHMHTDTHRHEDTQTQTQTNAYGQARRQTNSQTQTHKHKHSYTNAHILNYALKQKRRDTLAEEHIQKHAHVKHLFRRQLYFTNLEMSAEQTCCAFT
jgi:hypothetical protein